MSQTTAAGLRAQAGYLTALGQVQDRRGALANSEELLTTAEAALKAEGVKPPACQGEGSWTARPGSCSRRPATRRAAKTRLASGPSSASRCGRSVGSVLTPRYWAALGEACSTTGRGPGSFRRS